MFPYKDENPTILTPYVTVGIVVVTCLVWLVYQRAGVEPGMSQSVCDLGVIPGRLFGYPAEPIMTPRGPVIICRDAVGGWHTVLTSIFLHGGWFHLIGNMLFLWVFGNNVEDAMGTAASSCSTSFVEYWLRWRRYSCSAVLPCQWWVLRGQSAGLWARTWCCIPRPESTC